MAALFLFACGTAPAAEGMRFTVTGFRVEGENPLSAAQTERALAPYRGEHRDISGLEAAAKALEAALHDAGWGFHRVVLPPQEVGPEVTLKVLKSTVGGVTVEGQRHFSEDNVRRSLPELKEGASPNLRRLARDIGLSNESQARQVNVSVKQGAQPDTVDATVKVEDRSPWIFLGGLDNSGTKEPARSRLTLGLQYANLFDLDHSLTAVYVTSPETTQAVKQYGAFYRAPIYAWGGSASAYWFKSTTDTGQVGGVFTVSGRGDFVGAGYSQRLLPLGRLQPSLSVSLDDKLFDDRTTFNGIPIGTQVRSRPLSLGANVRGEGRDWNAYAGLTYLDNLSGGSHNDDASYAAARLGARPDWEAWRFSLGGTVALPWNLALTARGSGQAADEPLIAGEQFGLGGFDSLRALEMREVLGDRGWQYTLELRSPVLPGLNAALVAFWDAGYVSRKESPLGTNGSEKAQDFGVGLRWEVLPSVSVSWDWAQLTDGTQFAQSGTARMYLLLRANY
jgi:hemolysin activation/secretion protein